MEKELTQAISEKRIVELRYSEKDRRVEPHLLGFNQTNKLVLSGWMLGPDGGWRAFVLEKITSCKITEDTFDGARPGFNSYDSTMRQILCHL